MLAAPLFLLASLTMQNHRPLIDLWPNGNPNGWTRSDQEYQQDDGVLIVHQVSKPTLEVFAAKGAATDAPTILVLPGGGYNIVALRHEGWEIAEALNRQGYHAAVLKYRIPNRGTDSPLHLAPLQDAQRAIRLLRSRGKQWGTNPDRVGVMGFSAGGHLAAVVSNARTGTYPDTDEHDRASLRVDFSILVYAAYLNRDGTTEQSPEVRVDADSPPAFLVLTSDDHIPLESSASYAIALKNAKVPVEIHSFPKGGHGYGLRSEEPGIKDWPTLLYAWLKRLPKV